MKKIIWIGLVLLILASVLLLINNVSADDKPFNRLTLPENNNIINVVGISYYDTILSVGLDAAGLNGMTVQIEKLSNAAKDQFDGELKAHIRYYNGIYYLFIDEFDRMESIEVISHEIIHVLQYNSGQLYYDMQSGNVVWDGETISLNEISYDKRPWEMDAQQRSVQLNNMIVDILYK